MPKNRFWDFSWYVENWVKILLGISVAVLLNQLYLVISYFDTVKCRLYTSHNIIRFIPKSKIDFMGTHQIFPQWYIILILWNTEVISSNCQYCLINSHLEVCNVPFAQAWMAINRNRFNLIYIHLKVTYWLHPSHKTKNLSFVAIIS